MQRSGVEIVAARTISLRRERPGECIYVQVLEMLLNWIQWMRGQYGFTGMRLDAISNVDPVRQFCFLGANQSATIEDQKLCDYIYKMTEYIISKHGTSRLYGPK